MKNAYLRGFLTLINVTLVALFSVSAHAAPLTISAAASLNTVLKEIAQHYEKTQKNEQLALNFAASGVLLQQIARGAPVDLFISADQETMDRAENLQLIDTNTRQAFVHNHLVLITPTLGQTNRPKTLAELEQSSVQRIAIGNPQTVPAGRYAQQLLVEASLFDVLESRLIYAENVRQVLDYVARGEVDVGFVYLSDAQTLAKRVRLEQILETPTKISYPLAIVSTSTKKQQAKAFIRFLKTPEVSDILEKHGFLLAH